MSSLNPLRASSQWRASLVRGRGLQPATAAMVVPGAVAQTPELPGTTVRPGDEVAIVKPPADKKLYRRLRLPNGMLVLLISDPAITKQSSTHSHSEQPQSLSEEDSGEEDSSASSGEVRTGSRAVPHYAFAKPTTLLPAA